MSEIISERPGSILSIELNRPPKKNAMTVNIDTGMADLLNGGAKDDHVRVLLWHRAGDSVTAGHDLDDLAKNPPGPGESPQALLIHALINVDKPPVAAVHGGKSGL